MQAFKEETGIVATAEPNDTSGLRIHSYARLRNIREFVTDGFRKRTWGLEHNGKMAKQQITHHSEYSSEEWKGGSYQDLMNDLSGSINMEPYEKMLREISNSIILKRLLTVTKDLRPQRKRRFTDTDGDWDLGRQWELKPFSQSYKGREPARTIEIVAGINFNSEVSAENIKRYGTLVWAICQILERLGIKVKVVLQEKTVGFVSGCEATCHIELKKEDEYLAPSLLAAAITPVFYRRAMFGIICLSADWIKKEVCGDLGRAIEFDEPIKFEKGKLFISSSIRGFNEDVEKQILKALSLGDEEEEIKTQKTDDAQKPSGLSAWLPVPIQYPGSYGTASSALAALKRAYSDVELELGGSGGWGGSGGARYGTFTSPLQKPDLVIPRGVVIPKKKFTSRFGKFGFKKDHKFSRK